jgi:putative pyruvate formate lyase activating enzyme
MGAAVTEETFVQICRTLQERGAENINLVTGSHAVPAVAPGIRAARDRGLVVPVLWNSSAYEGDPALDLLEADVYLPDLKTLDPSVSGRFFKAPDYPGHAEKAVLRMIGRRGLRYGPSRRIGAGKAGPESPARVQTPRVLVSGVIIRHLVLPGYLDSTREVLRWFAEHGRGRALLSLMTQYTPSGGNDGEISKGPGMPRRGVDTGEYETLLRWLEEFDIGDGFYQELGSENTGWLPDFRRENPFPPELFLPVWHWERGFV